MIYAGYTLVGLLVMGMLFVIGNLIYEFHRKQYVQNSDDVIYNYIGKTHDYETRGIMYVLQSTKTGDIVSMTKTVLNKNFRAKK